MSLPLVQALYAFLLFVGRAAAWGLVAASPILTDPRAGAVILQPHGFDELTEENQYDPAAKHHNFLRSDAIPPVMVTPEQWRTMAAAQRDTYREAYRRYLALMRAEQVGEAETVLLEYARSPGRLLVKDRLLQAFVLGDEKDEPSDQMLSDVRRLLTSPSRSIREFMAIPEVEVLIDLGRREEALAKAKALPGFGVGGLKNPEDIRRISRKAHLLLTLGDRDGARQAFLSASPDRPVLREEYVRQADLMASYIGMVTAPGDREAVAAAADNFRAQIARRYPESITPDFLPRMAQQATLADRPERAAELLALLKQHHPGSQAYHAAVEVAAVKALADGDAETAVELNGELLDDPSASPTRRADAARRLRMLGVPAAEPELTPVPDPNVPAAPPE